ncbi:MAG: hypothetical protein DRP26_01605 [Candidatus Zixiibacteriota bacterium]|nr:MAG: hypothetical protein DRP26_01605 [candidate division Zixibacteria bacterium]
MVMVTYISGSIFNQTQFHYSTLTDNISLKILLFCFVFLFSSVTASYSGNTPIRNQSGLSIKETFNLYVKAVQNSNLEGLFTTVTDSDDFFFLTANGKLIDRKGYYDFHKEWFKERDWEMPVELLKVRQGNEYGYTNAIFHYRSKTPEGKTYLLDSYFTLIFHKENGMWKVVADVCTPIGRYLTDDGDEIRYDWQQVYLFDMIKKRRTVRKFKSNPVPREHILKILDAARYAPTAGNQQPWKFLVIQDKRKLSKLKDEAVQWYIESYKNEKQPNRKELENTGKAIKNKLNDILSAPVYIAVLVDSKAEYPEYVMYDGTLAAGYLMIEARSLGYGTGFFTTFFPEKNMKLFFGIPDRYKLICFTPIGIPEHWPDTPHKKSLEEIVVFESF